MYEIAESIYEFVVETYHKKPTQVDANRAGHIRQNRGEAALSWTCPNNGESAGKCRKRHVDSLEGESYTSPIHVPGNSSEECKVLGEFRTKYANSRPTKYFSRSPVPR